MDKPFLVMFMRNQQEIIAQKVRLASEEFKVIAVDIDSEDGTPNMARVGKGRLILAKDEKDGLRKALRLLAFYEPRPTCFCSAGLYTGMLGTNLINNMEAFIGPKFKKNVWNTALSLEKIPFLTDNYSALLKGRKRLK
jgi:hypothetical protein